MRKYLLFTTLLGLLLCQMAELGAANALTDGMGMGGGSNSYSYQPQNQGMNALTDGMGMGMGSRGGSRSLHPQNMNALVDGMGMGGGNSFLQTTQVTQSNRGMMDGMGIGTEGGNPPLQQNGGDDQPQLNNTPLANGDGPVEGAPMNVEQLLENFNVAFFSAKLLTRCFRVRSRIRFLASRCAWAIAEASKNTKLQERLAIAKKIRTPLQWRRAADGLAKEYETVRKGFTNDLRQNPEIQSRVQLAQKEVAEIAVKRRGMQKVSRRLKRMRNRRKLRNRNRRH